MTRITADLLLHAYAQGFFPMAESAMAEDIFWLDPEQRGILPLESFHVPRRLARTVRADLYHVTADQAFGAVLDECARAVDNRESTWINGVIADLYNQLYQDGHAHSIECWHDGRLVGGLYGVSLGTAFFGESMFSRERDASKVALVHLVARLKAGKFRLLDSQFVTDHLRQFGSVEISRADYRRLLSQAIKAEADYGALPSSVSGSRSLQEITETS